MLHQDNLVRLVQILLIRNVHDYLPRRITKYHYLLLMSLTKKRDKKESIKILLDQHYIQCKIRFKEEQQIQEFPVALEI